MATVKKSRAESSASHEDAPQRILSAATKLFALRGYDGTTTKEICELAKVNIAAIHYHFESKEALFRLIIERFGDSRLESVQRILAVPETSAELRVRLELFLSESLAGFFAQPDLCRIVQAEIELLHKRSEAVFRKTFVRLFDTLRDFLAGAQKNGLVRKGVDPKLAAHTLFSQLRQATRGEAVNSKYFHISLRDEAFRAYWVQHSLSIFLGGIENLSSPSDGTRRGRAGARKKTVRTSA